MNTQTNDVELHPNDAPSIVRSNMIRCRTYTPYCGDARTKKDGNLVCSGPRTYWSKVHNQMKCPECAWITEFPDDFIARYKEAHNIK